MEKTLRKLVEIGLEYSVDQTYILEEIESVLNGKKIDPEDIHPEDYM